MLQDGLNNHGFIVYYCLIIMVYHGSLWFIIIACHGDHCYKVTSLGWIPEIIPKWPIVCLTQVSELFEVAMIIIQTVNSQP